MLKCWCDMEYKVVEGLRAHQARHAGVVYHQFTRKVKPSLWRRILRIG